MPRSVRGMLIYGAKAMLKESEQTVVTVAEIICTCLARQVRDGEVVAVGLATPLGAAAAVLAKRTHAPSAYVASAIATSVTQDPPELSLIDAEGRWVEASLTSSSFVQGATDYLPSVRPKEFFRPGQVDQNGNFNNVAIGKDYRRPRLRMPGVGGIPDVSVFMEQMCLYVPRHSRIAFPKALDYRSGLGHDDARRRGSGPHYLVTNLGQFDFVGGVMRLTHLHPGVRTERVQAKTGFELQIANDLHETELPTEVELEVLRTQVDPLGIRRLETFSGSERRAALRQIVDRDRS